MSMGAAPGGWAGAVPEFFTQGVAGAGMGCLKFFECGTIVLFSRFFIFKFFWNEQSVFSKISDKTPNFLIFFIFGENGAVHCRIFDF